MLRTKFLDGQVASIKSIEMLLPLNCFGVVGGSCHGSLAGPEFVARGEVATSKNYPANQARAAQNRTGCGVRLRTSGHWTASEFALFSPRTNAFVGCCSAFPKPNGGIWTGRTCMHGLIRLRRSSSFGIAQMLIPSQSSRTKPWKMARGPQRDCPEFHLHRSMRYEH